MRQPDCRMDSVSAASDALAVLLGIYSQTHPRRANGGLYAMAGFAFQAEVAISRAVSCLVASEDFAESGRVFVEALSDVAEQDRDGSLVLLQVKRTLTSAALDSAADEIAAIEGVDAAQPQPLKPHYGVVCQYHEIALDWSRLPSASPHSTLLKQLQAEGRLRSPQQAPNPRWQILSTIWNSHSDPFGYLRFALDRIMQRQVVAGDAAACWEVLAERYQQGRIHVPRYGQRLDIADVCMTDQVARHLEVGRRITWDRWRRGQYMPRPELVSDAVSEALALHAQGMHAEAAELSVYWLAGRSGAGKSVILLNVVSELVMSGYGVLWLKPEELEPALIQIARGDASAAPDFLAVDDVFDPDAQDKIDLARISNLIDEQGLRRWPVLLTCGPTEFADDFNEQSRLQGFSMQKREVPLLDRTDTETFMQWAALRIGADGPAVAAGRWSGMALSQSAKGQGLFVSVATELANGDMSQFGQRFAIRLKRHGSDFVRRMRQCLAVNRLYMRAPAAWLGSEDREHLEDINSDGDFVLDAGDAGQDWLRLTHPHLSDAIYPHLLQTAKARLFAEDLGDAFQRALREGHDALAQRLLITFSNDGGQARAERMRAVDDKYLAQLCVRAWQACPDGIDVGTRASMRVSLVCWPAARSCLGTSIDGLIVEALQDIDCAEGQTHALDKWPLWWRRLWRCSPGHALLVNWVVQRLAASARLASASWSHVWEDAWHYAEGGQRDALEASAFEWLSAQGHRADWHFVWKTLRHAPRADQRPFVNLLSHALPHESGSHWAYAWQEALLTPPDGHNVSGLVAQGCEWLTRGAREDQWAHVWQLLLAQADVLPQGWSEQRLIALGCDWLAEREDRAPWKYVWEILLTRGHALPKGWSKQRLLRLGCEWLSGREGREQWKYVWELLLVHAGMLQNEWSESRLLSLGCEWLLGREEEIQWAFVWQILMTRLDALPEDWSEQRLVKLGAAWLVAREDRDGWPYVWQLLLKVPQALLEDCNEPQLIRLGCQWLMSPQHRESWGYVWEILVGRHQELPEGWSLQSLLRAGLDTIDGVDSPEAALPILKRVLGHRQHLSHADLVRSDALVVRWLPALSQLAPGPASHALEAMLDGGLSAAPGVLDATLAWCIENEHHGAWSLILVKALAAWPAEPALLGLVPKLKQRVLAHPNAGWLFRADIFLASFDIEASPPVLQDLVRCIRSRREAPAWDNADRWFESGEELDVVVVAGGDRPVVELPGGLLAVLVPAESGLHPGQSIRGVVTSSMRSIDRIYVRRAGAANELPQVGDVLECRISGFKSYGIFCKSGPNSIQILIMPSMLPSDRGTWEVLFPLGSRQKVKITRRSEKGFNGKILEKDAMAEDQHREAGIA